MSGKLFAICAALAMAGAAKAQTDDELKEDIATLKLERELLKERAGLAKDKAERIKALGLPSYAGDATLNPGAGNLEAAMLATHAVNAAAEAIAKVVNAKSGAAEQDTAGKAKVTVMVISAAEPLDFGMAQAVDIEVEAIETAYDAADAMARTGRGAQPGRARLLGGGLEAPIAAVTAIAGLLRSDVEITAATVQVGDAALVAAVASRVTNAIIPSQAIGSVPAGATTLLGRWKTLTKRRVDAAKARAALGAKPADDKKPLADLLDAANARFDAFAAIAAKADQNGALPLVKAARLQQLESDGVKVLRVSVAQAGGSIIKTKNIATMFGVDPLKVSGGVIAHYQLTKASDGSVPASGTLSCRTTLARLRPIQEDDWELRTAPASSTTAQTTTQAVPKARAACVATNQE